MAGVVNNKRDVNRRGKFPGLYASSLTGGITRADATIFLESQDTTSFRSGGALGDVIENPRELLAANENKNRFPYDNGHEFHTKKTTVKLSHPDVTLRSPYHNAWYKGPIIPVNLGFSGFTSPTGPRFHLPIPAFDLTKGTRALNETRPTKSAANFSRSVAELILSMPKIPLAGLLSHPPLNLRQLGRFGANEYLNAVFGWQPTVSDWIKIFLAVHRTEEILNQYIRDAGKNSRRHLKFDPVESVTSSVLNNSIWQAPRAYNGSDVHSDLLRNLSGSMQGGTRSNIQITETTVQEYRFSGAWTYWLDGDSTPVKAIRHYARLVDKVLGTEIDLDVIWQLAPWTWLSDWFVNIGDILAVNESLAKDSLVLRYGYITRLTSVERLYSAPSFQFLNRSTGPITVRILTKDLQRVRATPYGFGLNTDSFTATQWAILAALGMSDGGTRLRSL